MNCQSFFFILKTDCNFNKFLIVCLDRLSVKTFHVEQLPLKRWQIVWQEYSSLLTIPDSVSEKKDQVEQITNSLDKATACPIKLLKWNNLLW